jgi:predicted Zn finger-like uncharacterized protein
MTPAATVRTLHARSSRPYKRLNPRQHTVEMILTCPSCGARYGVDANAIGPGGRRVKCVRCGHLWIQPPPAPAAPVTAAPPPPAPAAQRAPRSAAPQPAPAAAPAAAAPSTPQPRQIPKGSNLPAIVERRANASATAWASMILVIGGLAAVLYFARDDVVGIWPQSLKLYETLGVPISDQVVSGIVRPTLELQNVQTSSGDGPRTIRLTGTIVNPTSDASDEPVLEARLLDSTDREVETRRIPLVGRSVPSGGSLSFQEELDNLPDGVVRIRIGIVAS